MKPSLTALAETIDEWAARGRCNVTENEALLAVSGLNAQDAIAIRLACVFLNWPVEVEDATPALVDPNDITSGFEPFTVRATKPTPAPNTIRIATNTALAAWLTNVPAATEIVQVARLTQAFETYALRFSPWENNTTFTPIAIEGDPRKCVRELGSARDVAANIGQWLLRQTASIDWNDPVVALWARKAVKSIGKAFGNELEADGAIMFKGPPVSRYGTQNLEKTAFSPAEFTALQNAAEWVFRSSAECESRHGLLAAEFARTNVGSSDAADLFKAGTASALEGAKIAHQLGLQKLSADTLKAISDLRKAIVDEAGKLSDTTRQLTTAVAGAFFAGVGLIVSRLTMTGGSTVIQSAMAALGVILFLYVIAVANSGRQFMLIQRELRKQWRDKLYRFLPEAEYETMVAAPAKKAEDNFNTSATISIVLAFGLMAVIIGTAFFGPIAGSQSQAAQAATQPSPAEVAPSPPRPPVQPRPTIANPDDKQTLAPPPRPQPQAPGHP